MHEALTAVRLRSRVYDALEGHGFCTLQDLALQLDSGTPATQAQVRAVLYAEPEVFWQDEGCWDLAIFHAFEGQRSLFRGRGGQGFSEDKFLDTVLSEALRVKGVPIDLVTLAEKYLMKAARGAGITAADFPRARGQILARLRRFLQSPTRFYILRQDSDEWVWTEPVWPEMPAAVQARAFQLRDDFLDRAFEFLKAEGPRPVPLSAILHGVLGIGVDHDDFARAFAQANAALSADSQTFVLVQDQAWMLVTHLPAEIEEIPARVAIPRWRNPQEEQIIQVTDDLPLADLAEASAFVEEEEADAEEERFDEGYLGTVRFVLPYHWRQAGVLKVNARERRLFPERPGRVRLTFQDRLTRQEFAAWINNDSRYLYGLADWYAQNLVPAGGIFYVQRSPGSKYRFLVWINESESHTFDGRQFLCEVDPETYIEEDRLRDLEVLRTKVQAAQATVKDVMCDLFESYPSGACLHYKQVWSQVHVVRPTTRRTVAAILSLFPCFRQSEPGSGSWFYVPALRDAPVERRIRPRPSRPAPPRVPRPRHYWLVPVSVPSWETLARPAQAGEGVFSVSWQGRARVAGRDQVVFCDTGSQRLLAAVQVLRAPVRDLATGLRELAVRPLIEAPRAVSYEEVASALSVPLPEAEGSPAEITLEDMNLLLERMRPIVAPPAEPTVEEMVKKLLAPEPTPPLPGEIIPHTYGPNPTIGAFIARYGRPYDPRVPYERMAFAYPVKAGKNTAIYNAHSYHTKVPPQGIEPYIEHYTEPGDIVLDPFCGSGMTGVAALRLGRRVILNDLSPAATHIAYNYCTPVDVAALQHEFERIRAAVKDEFDWLYGTTCDRCGRAATIQHTIWSDVYRCAGCGEAVVLWQVAVDRASGEVLEEFSCPSCHHVWRKAQLERLRTVPVVTVYECRACTPKRAEHPTTDAERRLIGEIEAREVPYWHPAHELDPEGEQYKRDALRLRNIRTVADFYTRRNLWALARLHLEVQACASETDRQHLLFWLTSFNWLASKMYRFRVHGGGGPQGRLTIPSLSKEHNVLNLAEDKWRAVEELFRHNQPASGACVISTASATMLSAIPDSSVDYVFTDPPFGSNLYYDDLNYIWEAWLGAFTDSTYEAVVHRARTVDSKTLGDYEHLMGDAFREMYRVLKPGRWASVVFHNSDDRVWRAIQRTAEDAGFDIVNAMVFDKEQRSFKGIRGEKGLENVTNFDIVLNLHKKSGVPRAAQVEAVDRIERWIVAAIEEHLRSGPSPDHRTGQYLHSLAIRTLLNESIRIELSMPQLERILSQSFRHVNCHWYLPKETVTAAGYGFLVRSDSAAVAWLGHILAANPQTLSDLIPQWQIATLGAGSRIQHTLQELLTENFWPDEATGLWCVPTAAQREVLKRRRKPRQLRMDLGTDLV